MFKVRIVATTKDGFKEKLPSKMMPSLPRKGDLIVYLNRDFVVIGAAWDLELEQVEGVVFLTEEKAQARN